MNSQLATTFSSGAMCDDLKRELHQVVVELKRRPAGGADIALGNRMQYSLMQRLSNTYFFRPILDMHWPRTSEHGLEQVGCCDFGPIPLMFLEKPAIEIAMSGNRDE